MFFELSRFPKPQLNQVDLHASSQFYLSRNYKALLLCCWRNQIIGSPDHLKSLRYIAQISVYCEMGQARVCEDRGFAKGEVKQTM